MPQAGNMARFHHKSSIRNPEVWTSRMVGECNCMFDAQLVPREHVDEVNMYVDAGDVVESFVCRLCMPVWDIGAHANSETHVGVAVQQVQRWRSDAGVTARQGYVPTICPAWSALGTLYLVEFDTGPGRSRRRRIQSPGLRRSPNGGRSEIVIAWEPGEGWGGGGGGGGGGLVRESLSCVCAGQGRIVHDGWAFWGHLASIFYLVPRRSCAGPATGPRRARVGPASVLCRYRVHAGEFVLLSNGLWLRNQKSLQEHKAMAATHKRAYTHVFLSWKGLYASSGTTYKPAVWTHCYYHARVACALVVAA